MRNPLCGRSNIPRHSLTLHVCSPSEGCDADKAQWASERLLQWEAGQGDAAAQPTPTNDDGGGDGDDDDDVTPKTSAAAPSVMPALKRLSAEKRKRAGLRKLAALCKLLAAHDFAWPFMEPVQPELQGLDRYDEVTHRPTFSDPFSASSTLSC